MVCFVPERHQKEYFTLAETTFTFPRSFDKEIYGFMRFGAAIGSALQLKPKCASCSLTWFRREDSRKDLNERIFARDGAVP